MRTKSVLFTALFCSAAISIVPQSASAEKLFKCSTPKPGDIQKQIAAAVDTALGESCANCTARKVRVAVKIPKASADPIIGSGFAGVELPEGSTVLKPSLSSYVTRPSECTVTAKAKVTISYKDAAGKRQVSSTEADIQVIGSGL